MAGVVVAGVAIIVAALAAFFAYRAASASHRSAEAAEVVDWQQRTPQLTFLLDNSAPTPVDRVICRVRNDGPQDLDSMVIYRPRPEDGITYPIATTGGGGGWADDHIELGPVAVTAEVSFTLCCGPAAQLPEFRVQIECRAGPDLWPMTMRLPPARPSAVSTMHE